jgi:hypothetical protein
VWAIDFDVARHFDGSTWSSFQIPNLKAWVIQVHTEDDGTAWFSTATNILRFDGIGWTEFDVGGYPSCIWGDGRGGVYAKLLTIEGEGIAIRFDGIDWRRLEVPFGVDDVDCGWSDGNGRIWIAGSISDQAVFVLLDDGAPWLVPVDGHDAEKTWTRDGHLWMHTGSELFRIDGPPWTSRGMPTTSTVRAIWASSAATAWVGTDGHIYRTAPNKPLGPFSIDGAVRDIWGTKQFVWFGGTFGVVRYIDGRFQREEVQRYITSLWGVSEDNVWALGGNDILHYDGVDWRATTTFPDHVTGNFVGTDVSNVWLRRANREFLFEAGTWIEVRMFDTGVLEATTGPTDHWLFDGNGYSYQHDGQTATPIRGTWRTLASSAWANSPRNLWVVANRGVHHFDGVTWSKVRLPTSFSPGEIAGAADTVWVGGAAGSLYTLPASLTEPYSGACAPALPTYCNVTLRGHTAQTVDGPTECNGVAHPGGELHYKIEVPVTGRLIAELLSRHNVDLSIVRADALQGCDAASCVGTTIGDDKIELRVEQGETYFLVVGARDEAAPFTLDVRCVKE